MGPNLVHQTQTLTGSDNVRHVTPAPSQAVTTHTLRAEMMKPFIIIDHNERRVLRGDGRAWALDERKSAAPVYSAVTEPPQAPPTAAAVLARTSVLACTYEIPGLPPAARPDDPRFPVSRDTDS